MIIIEQPASANPEILYFDPETKPKIHVLGHVNDYGEHSTGARSIKKDASGSDHLTSTIPLVMPPDSNLEASLRVVRVIGDYNKVHGEYPTHIILLTLHKRIVGIAATNQRPMFEDLPPLDSPQVVLQRPGERLTKGIRPDWPKS